MIVTINDADYIPIMQDCKVGLMCTSTPRAGAAELSPRARCAGRAQGSSVAGVWWRLMPPSHRRLPTNGHRVGVGPARSELTITRLPRQVEATRKRLEFAYSNVCAEENTKRLDELFPLRAKVWGWGLGVGRS